MRVEPQPTLSGEWFFDVVGALHQARFQQEGRQGALLGAGQGQVVRAPGAGQAR